MKLTANPYPAGSDEYYMREAVQLAHRGLGWTSPNPLVGCVLVKDGTVLARAAHLHDGEEHAEVLALRQAGEAARGATCYVNLEPCSHVGRQPACCQQLAAAGVACVVYGCRDADQRTAGMAATLLPELGIETREGVLQEECEDFLDYYLENRRGGRPYMHLKLALSLDGKVACANGNSQWLSGPESLGYAHYLRQKYDAVLVGYRTVLADNPRLTVRPDVLAAYRPLDEGTPARNPVPVILDPHLETLPRLAKLHLWKAGGSFREQLPRAIYVAEKSCARTAGGLPPGVEIIGLPKTGSGKLKLGKLSRALARLGIRSVLVEGGARLAQEAIRQQAVDKVSLVITPKLIGRDGLEFTPLLGCHSVEHCLRLCHQQVDLLGNDVVLSGKLNWWDYHGSLAKRSRKLRKQLLRVASELRES